MTTITGRQALIENEEEKVPGPVDITILFSTSITQSIHKANPWQIPGFVNSTCSISSFVQLLHEMDSL